MEENWIKIDEIKYTHEDLSKIYEALEEKDLSDNTKKIEDLIQDNFFIQELKNNAIPYKCTWSERLMENKGRIPKVSSKIVYHYFIEIWILESYKLKYENILKNIEMTQYNMRFEDLDHKKTENSNEYSNIKILGGKKKEEKREKPKITLSIISFMLFIGVVVMFLLSLYVDTTGFLIAASIWLGFIPFMTSIALAIISIVFYFRDKENKKVTTILTGVNIIQLIAVFILIFNIGSINKVMSTIKFNPAKKELDKIYGDNYEIIDSCHIANAGGTNEITAIIKLKNENEYSLVEYDITDKEFTDCYNNIKKGEKIALDEYFDKDILWLASANESVYTDDDFLTIAVIVNYNDYNIEELSDVIKNIVDTHIQKGYADQVEIKMFFTDNIDYSKLEDYKLLLTSQLVDDGFGVDEEFFEKFNKNLVYKNYYDDNHFEDYYNLEEIRRLLDAALNENGI